MNNKKIYGGGGGAISVGWRVVFIEKKAMASKIHAMSNIIAPTKIIVRMAPMSNNVPAVLNIFSPDFSAIILKDFL